MTISIIAAIGPNRELGKDNKLLWHLPGDLPRFKKLTVGHAVIMGRKTFESLGKPLPSRLNIVLSRHSGERRDSRIVVDNNDSGQAGMTKLIFVSSLEEAIDFVENLKSKIEDLKSKDEVFIIGGGQIYAQALSFTDKLYLTIVEKTPDHPDGKFEADTFFPEYKKIFKKVVFEEKREEKGYKYRFKEIIR